MNVLCEHTWDNETGDRLERQPFLNKQFMIFQVKGQDVLIDDEDARVLKGKTFYLFVRDGKSYVLCYDGERTHRLHRLICEISDPSIVVDHKDGNPLDNRKQNLRVCVQMDNSRNRSKSIKREYTSKYKGICLTRGSRWVASIRVSYKRIHLGTFRNEHEAAEAYNQAAIKYFGEFAKTNQVSLNMASNR